ncbi:heavy metal sensor histidine kinase [Shimwellia pseudoproteus]|uniref:Cu(+)/Ag(+) sensor histidine kinase n=1 Tax=Shimwellia pseudoproteus TaxID=570012 RepID=UPI0018EB2AED|nr:Cu(+)/Ag(+) sensor histidine kinase [Shimwellia pseudoproteus]MBJ3816713.1 heavy metal sensor histidine kinase [Shimwellia pseudoproteus]
MRSNALGRSFSLAFRLTFFICLSTIVAFFVFTWIMINSVEKHFAEQDVNDLTQISANVMHILADNRESLAERVRDIEKVTAAYQNVFVYLTGQNGELLFQTAGLPNLAAFSPRHGPHDQRYYLWNTLGPAGHGTLPSHHASHKETTYRVIAVPVVSTLNGQPTTHRLVMAMSMDFHLHYINSLKYKLVISALIISLLIILLVLVAVHRGHAPLRAVSTRIGNISSANLDVRLNPSAVPIELEQLVKSFNHMIERIEDVFTRQSHFSADIAHEIRTPITNLITQTEIALSQQRCVKELEDILYSNLEEFHRMAKMVSDMLFLAQADNNQLIPESTLIDLQQEVIKVFDFFEAFAEERGVALVLTGEPQLLYGDPLMIRRAINNLLSNAIRYTPKGERVLVTLSHQQTAPNRQQTVTLTVENPGQPIPASHLPRLFDRFYRVDPSRQRKGEGSGIGLAIVKSIIKAHHGEVIVTSDATSTRFTLQLPARPPA